MYKKDWNALGIPAEIFIKEVNEDGLSFPLEVEATLILKATQLDELFVVEGQSLIYVEPYYYVIYSGNWFDHPYYHASVARSEKVS